MSDMRPEKTEVMLGGKKRTLLFTLNAIDMIQSRCNMTLYDVIREVARIADNEIDHDALVALRSVVTALINEWEEKELSEEEVGKMLTKGNMEQVAWKVIEAYGISVPEPDEDSEEDEDEDEDDPKREAGQ